MVLYFNSRPHKEVDIDLTTTYNFLDISTHDLTRRSTSYHALFLFRCSIFQLTTSQGGRLLLRQRKQTMHTYFNSRPHKEVDFYFCNSITVIVPFQLTTSQGGRPMLSFRYQPPLAFQLTTSQGGRPVKIIAFFNYRDFNSRPHKEVDP